MPISTELRSTLIGAMGWVLQILGLSILQRVSRHISAVADRASSELQGHFENISRVLQICSRDTLNQIQEVLTLPFGDQLFLLLSITFYYPEPPVCINIKFPPLLTYLLSYPYHP